MLRFPIFCPKCRTETRIDVMNFELKVDDNMKNSFSFTLSEDKNSNVILKDQFIIGIFANKIINNERLPLIQFLYVKKEDFLPKKN